MQSEAPDSPCGCRLKIERCNFCFLFYLHFFFLKTNCYVKDFFFQSGKKIGGCCAVVTVRCLLGILKKTVLSRAMERPAEPISIFFVWSLIGMFWASPCRMMSAQGLTLKGLLHVCQRARQVRPPSLPSPPLHSLLPSPPLLPSVWIPFARTCGILCHRCRLRTLLFFFPLCFFFSLSWRKDQFENWDETTESRVIAF